MNKYLLLILLLMSSCAPFILINDNYYRGLTKEQLQEVRTFGDPPVTDSSKKFLVEITVNDLVSSFKNAPYTWVHTWVPYCKGEHCMPLSYYDNILQQHKGDGVQLFLISSTYSYKSVKQQVPYFSGDVYVIQDERYGHSHGNNLNYFREELRYKSKIPQKTLYSDLLFKDDSLIYTTNHMTNAKMDSVIRATKGVE